MSVPETLDDLPRRLACWAVTGPSPRPRSPGSRLPSLSAPQAGSAREPGQTTSMERWPCARVIWPPARPGGWPAGPPMPRRGRPGAAAARLAEWCGALSEYAVYAGLAVGGNEEHWSDTWQLAVAVMIVLSVRRTAVAVQPTSHRRFRYRELGWPRDSCVPQLPARRADRADHPGRADLGGPGHADVPARVGDHRHRLCAHRARPLPGRCCGITGAGGAPPGRLASPGEGGREASRTARPGQRHGSGGGDRAELPARASDMDQVEEMPAELADPGQAEETPG